MGGIAVLALVDAAQRSGRMARRLWLFWAVALAIYSVGQAVFTSYTTVLNAPFFSPWISDQLFFFWVAPLLMAALMTSRAWR